jgi:short-subunit dehydrogenase
VPARAFSVRASVYAQRPRHNPSLRLVALDVTDAVSLYNSTKFAIVGFTESLSYEIAALGIRAKFIAPGGVATEFAGNSLARTFKDVEHAYGATLPKAMACECAI